MDRWSGRVAVVTGASSGIGEAIAEQLVECGMIVVALARREDRLKQLEQKLKGKKGRLHPLKTDITKMEDIQAALEWIDDKLGAIHVLINNAGIFINKKFQECEMEEILKLFTVNVLSLGKLTKEVISSMERHKIELGHIFNISSIAGKISHPFPQSLYYFASKRAVDAISEGLRMEIAVAKSKIKVSNVSPGLVMTELIENAGFEHLTSETPRLYPKDVAEGVVFALSTPPHMVVTELTLQPLGESIYSFARH
ncbi:hypothetical protein LSTR_LSTR004689 [Laodelphax striatellus]|uniref:Farnesol dehydrogenase-like n=1 Tax=Laodelphax striatellus TaxID=195883 RepID=A0A482WV17_LAOST|nr:hypothetical protein LSTR_LSTR004689 [Laodelphax striatellus]